MPDNYLKYSFRWIALLLTMLMASCNKPNKTEATHFNIDSLVAKQVVDLWLLKAALIKEGSIGDIRQDTLLTSLDTVRWKKELDIFSEIGLVNKPAYRALYTVKDGLRDASSNLTIREFETDEELPVQSLKLFYLDNLQKLRRIEALIQQENALLKTQQKLVMEFSDVYNKNVLTSYSIEGGQKMLAGDSVHFTLSGTIQFN
ncbi:MAG: hypothetical protein KF803_06030 [Cyclobacteriaceae bacterium]|nr:hypothetical protein [Cyclobacteriaceae bacterium]